jgi:glutamyl-tRNA synthetase
MPHVQERMKTLVEAREQLEFLFTDELTYTATDLIRKKDATGTRDVLGRSLNALRDARPFEPAAIDAAVRKVAEETGWKVGDVAMPIRVAVTGRTVGPPLNNSMEILGAEKTFARIDRARTLLNGGTA